VDDRVSLTGTASPQQWLRARYGPSFSWYGMILTEFVVISMMRVGNIRSKERAPSTHLECSVRQR